MTPRRIYIAGPMSGLPDENRPEFHAYDQLLREYGHVVLNPATLPPGLTEDQYMDICLAMLRASDEVHLLPGWEQSAGAQVEYHYARKRGLYTEEVAHLLPLAKKKQRLQALADKARQEKSLAKLFARLKVG
jgi:hypothetical protein